MWSESERIPLIDKAAQRRTGAAVTALFGLAGGMVRAVGKYVKGVDFKAAKLKAAKRRGSVSCTFFTIQSLLACCSL